MTNAVSHTSGEPLPWETFFDIDRVRLAAKLPIVTWRQMKKLAGQEEALGCWGMGAPFNDFPQYNMRTTFWPLPTEDPLTFNAIAGLSSGDHSEWLDSADFANASALTARPDERLLCFRELYRLPDPRAFSDPAFVESPLEDLSATNPVWSEIGTHFKFNDQTLDIAYRLLSNSTKHSLSSRTPYIGVHIRQGDFIGFGHTTGEHLDRFITAVGTIQGEFYSVRPHNVCILINYSRTIGEANVALPVVNSCSASRHCRDRQRESGFHRKAESVRLALHRP